MLRPTAAYTLPTTGGFLAGIADVFRYGPALFALAQSSPHMPTNPVSHGALILNYLLAVIYGDSRTAEANAAGVRKAHMGKTANLPAAVSNFYGFENETFSPNNPRLQMDVAVLIVRPLLLAWQECMELYDSEVQQLLNELTRTFAHGLRVDADFPRTMDDLHARHQQVLLMPREMLADPKVPALAVLNNALAFELDDPVGDQPAPTIAGLLPWFGLWTSATTMPAFGVNPASLQVTHDEMVDGFCFKVETEPTIIGEMFPQAVVWRDSLSR